MQIKLIQNMYLVECLGDAIIVALDGEDVFLFERLIIEGYTDVVAEVYSIDLLFAKCIVYGNTRRLVIGAKVYRRKEYLSLDFNKSKIGLVLDPLLNIVSSIYPNPKEEENINQWSKSIPVRKQSLNSSNVKYNPVPVSTGIKVIDFFLPYSDAGKLGIVGGAGVGKTTFILDLIHPLSKKGHFHVFSGVGERIREGRALYMDIINSGLIDKDNPNDSNTCLIYGTMDQTAAMRTLALMVSTSIAEYVRDDLDKNVILVVDNVFRYNQALMELSASLGNPLSEGGYHPDLYSGIANIMEKIVQTIAGKCNSITGIFAIYVPADNAEDPGVLSCVTHMDTMVYLDREISKQKRFPAVNILNSSTSMITTERVGAHHVSIYKKAISILKRYEEISEIINIIGEDNLSFEDKQVVARARIIYSYMTQALSVSAAFNNMVSTYVNIDDVINDMEKIVSGVYDDVDHHRFMYIGKII